MVTAPKRPARVGGVKRYSPQVRVVLRKNIGRATVGGDIAVSERFRGERREIDLTGYLGTTGGVETERSARTGTGRFTIDLVDRIAPDLADSLYGLIEPMDVIEIRLARDPSKYTGGKLPLVMRGFVGEVTRTQSMSARGPQRMVRIAGQDYGRILENCRIIYLLGGSVLGQNLLTAYRFATAYGDGSVEVKDAADFVADTILTDLISKFIKQMQGLDGATSEDAPKSPILNIAADVEAARGKGIVSPFGVQDWPGGTVWEMLRYFGDVGPFFEAFIRDEEDGPKLVYRPNPFRDLSGKTIWGDAPAGGDHTIYDADIVRLDVARSDANVFNYFWVDAPRFNLIDQALFKYQAAISVDGAAPPDWYLLNYGNANPRLYGERVTEVQSQQGIRFDGLAKDVQDEASGDMLTFLEKRRNVLAALNRDNVVLESGQAVVSGDETIQHGEHVTFRRGKGGEGLKWSAYGHTVAHRFSYGGPFLTTITFDRGTGFVERAQKGTGKDAPYALETSLRGAYGR